MFAIIRSSTPSSNPSLLHFILPHILAILTTALIFAPSVSYFLQLWWPLTCSSDVNASCDFEPTVALLGVALAALVHAVLVAVFTWSPLSRFFIPVLSQKYGNGSHVEVTTSVTLVPASASFDTFLFSSFLLDMVMFGSSFRFVQESNEYIEAAVIAFNLPILISIPYLLAAYRIPTSSIGRILHRIKHLASSSNPSSSACLFSCEEVDQRASLLPTQSPLLDHGVVAAGESALERDLRELGLLSSNDELDQWEREKMRPFPRTVSALAGHGKHTPDLGLLTS